MRERWWISNYNSADVVGGTEKSAEKYCKILKLKYMSASKLGINPAENSGWETAKRIDEVLSGVPLEFLMYNSVNCWYKKPVADKSLCLCNENFNREAQSMKDDGFFYKFKMEEWEYQKKSIANADKVLTVSKWERDNLKSDLGVDSEILESSTELKDFFPLNKGMIRTGIKLDKDKTVFLFVGRQHKRKGYDIILDLAKEYPDAVFINVVGVPGVKIDNMFEMGGVTTETLNMLYNCADYLLVPSRYESFGLMFTEALATNLPIVGCKVGIAYDIPEDHIEFSESATTESFKKAIERAKNRTFSPGRGLAEKRFSTEVMTQRLLELAK